MLKTYQFDSLWFNDIVKNSDRFNFLSELIYFRLKIETDLSRLDSINGLKDFRVVHRYLSSSFYIEKDDDQIYAIVNRDKIIISICSKINFSLCEENLVFSSKNEEYNLHEFDRDYFLQEEKLFCLYDRYPVKEVNKDDIAKELMKIDNFKKGYLLSTSTYCSNEYRLIERKSEIDKFFIERESLHDITLVIKHVFYRKPNIFFVTKIDIVVNFNENSAILSKL